VVGRLTIGRTSRAALVAALLFFSVPLLGRASSLHQTARENAFLAGMNDVRAQHGLAPLTVDLRLVRSARSHSTTMVKTNTFAHGAFWQRIESYGVRSGTVGETLGWAEPVGTAESRVIRMWIESFEHRVILLGGSYRTVGIGISIGPFHGWPHALVVTADYHAPAK
jgi:uncharacterized protein YkwD